MDNIVIDSSFYGYFCCMLLIKLRLKTVLDKCVCKKLGRTYDLHMIPQTSSHQKAFLPNPRNVPLQLPILISEET